MQQSNVTQSNLMKSNHLIRVALYARVSSQHQAQDGTIASQVQALLCRIAADGLSVDAEMRFCDDGFSGSTLDRPALEKLRDMADAGAMDRLYVLSPDRLARNYAYQVVVVDELRRCGVEVIFLNHDLGRSPEGDMLLQVQGIIAQYERAQIMERSRRGKLHAAKRGSVSVLSQAPYGYRYIPKSQGGGDATLSILLEQAGTVRQIFAWVGTERLSLSQVCARLEKQGILSPSGMKRWNRSSVFQILRNPAYIGQAAYGRTRSGPVRKRPRPVRNASSRRVRGVYSTPPEQWVRLPVPAIVDSQSFAAVAEQLEENRLRNRRRAGSVGGLLAGLTVCGKCGHSVCVSGGPRQTPGDASRYRYYRCLGRNAYRNGGAIICDNPTLVAEPLEAAVWRDICELLEDPSRICDEYERRLDREDSNNPMAQEKQKLLDASNQTRRAISRLIDAWTDGLLEKQEFEIKIKAARARLDRLEGQIQDQNELEASRAEMRLIIGSLDAFASRVKQGLTDTDFAAKRDIIVALVKRVEINHHEVRIVYRINPGPDPPVSGGKVLQHCSERLGALGAYFSVGSARWPMLPRALCKTASWREDFIAPKPGSEMRVRDANPK